VLPNFLAEFEPELKLVGNQFEYWYVVFFLVFAHEFEADDGKYQEK
jgi:hypothetical protein